MNEQALALQRQYWNKQHEHYTVDTIKTDRWLEDFKESVMQCKTPIIDLGCGSGNNVLTLTKWDKDVIACDYSENAIVNIKKNFPQVDSHCFDMTKGLPFGDNFTDIIIADLSLHYFNEQTTFFILAEIKRVLKSGGTLLFRLNSMNDVHYGAGVGTEVELHYYLTGESSYKRFFDERDVRRFFNDWQLDFLQEQELIRYDHPKKVWVGLGIKGEKL